MIDAQCGVVRQKGMISEILDNDPWLRLTAVYESRVLTAVGGCRTQAGGRVGRHLGSD